MRNFFRKIAGRAGKASRGKRGANSHVNTKRNKRAASKAVRHSEADPFAYDDVPMLLYNEEEELH